ncbi:VanZ family protein [Bacillus sp. UNC41MFS5]|uniref:VanZ family protein n=1 Tax=Bacillus sp. UNC41MFS5 TaxID=1449046 RepID=UPI0012DCD725|nr:VanZ family protein [Bacillus sp. UNC41MFS5]
MITIIFMSVIFIQSNTPYKQQDIKPFLEEMIELKKIPITFFYNDRVISGYRPYEFLEFVLRKAGHVVQYSILTLILIKTLSFIKARLFTVLSLSFILSFIIALFDEWHQRFIAGRTGQLIDVFTFDLFGIILAILGFLWAKKYKVNKLSESPGKTKKI